MDLDWSHFGISWAFSVTMNTLVLTPASLFVPLSHGNPIPHIALPRILIGVTPYFVYRGYTIVLVLNAIVGSMTNTILFYWNLSSSVTSMVFQHFLLILTTNSLIEVTTVCHNCYRSNT
ncbi:MAG: hypothetical protein ACLUAO_02775 [Streptococcus sp.]